MPIERAISIRQPYAELILTGRKREEYRSLSTRIRERVWIYASARPADDPAAWRRAGQQPGDLPTAVIVGSIEIADCRKRAPGDFAYKLIGPKRLPRPKRPRNHPQPVFWRPRF